MTRDKRRVLTCTERLLQTSIFNIRSFAQRVHYIKETFYLGEVNCTAPMTNHFVYIAFFFHLQSIFKNCRPLNCRGQMLRFSILSTTLVSKNSYKQGLGPRNVGGLMESAGKFSPICKQNYWFFVFKSRGLKWHIDNVFIISRSFIVGYISTLESIFVFIREWKFSGPYFICRR